MPRLLYNIGLPLEAQQDLRNPRSQQVASRTPLDSGVSDVDAIGPEAGGHRLQGVVGGKFGQLTAAELEELFNAAGIKQVPYFESGGVRTRNWMATTSSKTSSPDGMQRVIQSSSASTADSKGRHPWVAPASGQNQRAGHRVHEPL
ncbi:hypothetical protein VB779_08705 [Haloarculaceae archaeon H-GB11]|nr:hypothetical protein [Haloarculaceae archaeon H-GB11]